MSEAITYQTVKSTIKPSQALRRHFMSLGRQVANWSEKRSLHAAKIGVTCLEPKVGKSTVSYNLASALEVISGEEVLFTESDFGKSFLVGRRNLTEGWAEVLTGKASPDEVLFQFENQPNLYALSAGKCQYNESVELPLSQIGKVIDDQLDRFRYVVFDLPVADGLSACDSIACELDGVLLVVDAQAIDRRAIDLFKHRMRRMDIEIIGLVINKV